MTAGLIAQARARHGGPKVPHVNKWELFRELCAGRAAFAVSDRDLTVLDALLSFHKGSTLSDNDSLVVFPSNRALGERAHGMAESTLRRHLAALVGAGLIRRHDSPNGKRYAARGAEGGIARAFGFDLRPLLDRAAEITGAAAEVRAATEHLRRLREEVSLLKRDAVKFAAYGQGAGLPGDWVALQAELLAVHRAMRRSLGAEALTGFRDRLAGLLGRIRALLVLVTEETDGNDGSSGRHYSNSNPELHESEPRKEQGGGDPGLAPDPELAPDHAAAAALAEPRLPLALVLKACPDVLPYAEGRVAHWHQFVALMAHLRAMMGVSPDAWAEAQQAMGQANAAITLSCILQRIAGIKNPGGYLRALARKAAAGEFSPGPMVMALLNADQPGRTGES